MAVAVEGRWVGGDLSTVALQEADSFYGCSEGHESRDFVPVGGYGPLVQQWAKGIDVRLNQRVEMVRMLQPACAGQANRATPRVCLELAGGWNGEAGRVLEARCVVVTASVAVLRAGRALAFDPPLPASKLAALHGIGMGLFNKVFMEFSAPFWPLDVDVFGFLPPTDAPSTPHPSLVINVHRVDMHNRFVLIGLFAGADARALERLSDEEALDAAMAPLRRAWGPAVVARPRHFTVTRWGSDELALGTYTYLQPGGKDEDRLEYARSLEGALFFAGEGTSVGHPACVDGACETGRRVAVEVLETLEGATL
jgi:hypothetical protein